MGTPRLGLRAGGELWIYEEGGDYEMQARAASRVTRRSLGIITSLKTAIAPSFPAWGTLAVARPPRLPASRTELSPVMAAEQFLPPGKF